MNKAKLFINKIWPYFICVSLVVIAAWAGMSFIRDVRAQAPEETSEQQIVRIAAEQMKVDVPVFNEVAPRLRKNRETLKVQGYAFDDVTLTAVPFDLAQSSGQ